MGSATEVTKSSGLIPGLGIKFPRTNAKSGNFVALHSLDPLPDNSYNFFAKSFSNHIPPPVDRLKKVLSKKFNQASGCAIQVGLSDLASVTQAGEKVEHPEFPFQLILEPADVSMPADPIDTATLSTRLNAIPIGTALFNVYAYRSPQAYAAG